ncbi:hypothetical protein EVAR_85602_1 [Eumeta japonica]|uniref:Uncharacterized protein n=1 Tax=Eumeta variegata TaxID=151549 RepID=A0A4C1XTB1_EUMVA|nr:hypothetical protein EVAR_85602_1 [Eumeta japonica]
MVYNRLYTAAPRTLTWFPNIIVIQCDTVRSYTIGSLAGSDVTARSPTGRISKNDDEVAVRRTQKENVLALLTDNIHFLKCCRLLRAREPFWPTCQIKNFPPRPFSANVFQSGAPPAGVGDAAARRITKGGTGQRAGGLLRVR